MPQANSPGSTERGSALVSAIGLSAVIAVIAVMAVNQLTHSARLVERVHNARTMDQAFESAVALGLLALAQAETPVTYDQITRVQTPGGAFEISWWSPHGQVDLNRAPPAMLEAALAAAGVPDRQGIAAAIIDWRDGDELVFLEGAEAAAYRRAGLDGPANRAFRHEGELETVLGLHTGWAQCVLPFVTVSSWQEAPRPELAPPALADSLSQTGQAIEPQGLAIVLEAGLLLGLRLRPTDLPEAEAVSVLLRLTGDPRQPYLVQAWEPVLRADPSCRGGGRS